jgi:hypothetical protein
MNKLPKLNYVYMRSNVILMETAVNFNTVCSYSAITRLYSDNGSS